MNTKVLNISIILVVVMLATIYFAKLVFPEWVVEIVTTPNMLLIGNFIDTHWWLRDLCSILLSITIYYLICCAFTRKWYLNRKEVLIIVAVSIVVTMIKHLSFGLFLAFSDISIILLAFLLVPNIKIKDVLIIFSIHLIAQVLSLGIRGIILYEAVHNFASLFILMIDLYIWIVLIYLLYNYKRKEEQKNGISSGKIFRQQAESTCSGKTTSQSNQKR